jgi:thiol-disulfide isomerase/thioredoxin
MVDAAFREFVIGGSKLMWRMIFLFLLTFSASAQNAHPILPLGSPAPDFSLPGVDGKIHGLADYGISPILVVVFTCNHCPIAQMYEQRIQQLEADYRDRRVAVVAIQPNDPKAIRIDELDSSDMSDTLDEMKIRVAYKNLHYPYLMTAKRNQSRVPTGRKPHRTSSFSTEIESYGTKAEWTIAIARKW